LVEATCQKGGKAAHQINGDPPIACLNLGKEWAER